MHDVILFELKAVKFFLKKKQKQDSEQPPPPSKKLTGIEESKKRLRQEHCAAMRRRRGAVLNNASALKVSEVPVPEGPTLRSSMPYKKVKNVDQACVICYVNGCFA